jgi:magnesium chelatase family protein
MVGPPDSSKTMLARRLPAILPLLSFDEAIEATKLYSIAGLLPFGQALLSRRPFRLPKHSSSDTRLIGGSVTHSGEVSLAHRGVLFPDELPESRLDALEALRQLLEDRLVMLARATPTFADPARLTRMAAVRCSSLRRRLLQPS